MTYHDLNDQNDGSIEATTSEEPSSPPASSSLSEKGSEAKEKASEVVGHAESAVGEVASTAKDQARVLTEEAKYQARELMTTTRQQLSEQAEQRAQHASRGLRSVADQMQALKDGRPQDSEDARGVDTARYRSTSATGQTGSRPEASTVCSETCRASPGADRSSSSGPAWQRVSSSAGW